MFMDGHVKFVGGLDPKRMCLHNKVVILLGTIWKFPYGCINTSMN